MEQYTLEPTSKRFAVKLLIVSVVCIAASQKEIDKVHLFDMKIEVVKLISLILKRASRKIGSLT